MPTISKTKGGGRFRAPTDQARKMDRKRENKRNKRDRLQIRQAMAKFCNLEETTSKLLVLERQILGLDPQPFHIDVLKKKQKVLTDLINKRRLTLQQAKDDDELKKFNDKLNIYHADCKKLATLAEQARLARETLPEMIPLPSGEMLPPDMQMAAPQIAKKKVDFQLPSRAPRTNQKPPGPPCGVAPEYSDDEDDSVPEAHFDDNDLGPVPIPEFEQHQPAYPPLYRNAGPAFPPRVPPIPQYIPHHAYNPMGFTSGHNPDNGVISSAPQINRNTASSSSSAPSGSSSSKPVQAVMSAAPELRNLRKETVKLVPAQLLRKTEKQPNRPAVPTKRRPEAQQQAKSTDDAYNDFMKELDGLI